jgi:hypothetical protein
MVFQVKTTAKAKREEDMIELLTVSVSKHVKLEAPGRGGCHSFVIVITRGRRNRIKLVQRVAPSVAFAHSPQANLWSVSDTWVHAASAA